MTRTERRAAAVVAGCAGTVCYAFAFAYAANTDACTLLMFFACGFWYLALRWTR
jgi:hypothetical protein